MNKHGTLCPKCKTRFAPGECCDDNNGYYCDVDADRVCPHCGAKLPPLETYDSDSSPTPQIDIDECSKCKRSCRYLSILTALHELNGIRAKILKYLDEFTLH